MRSSLVVLVFCLLLSKNAAAEDLGVVAVAPLPGPSPELVGMTGQLRTALAERGAGVLDARALRDRMSGRSPGASLGELDKAYDAALAAYLSGDYEGSLRTLRAIVEDLGKLPDDPETYRQWSRAMMRLAATELDLDRRELAREAALELLRADPAIKVDAAQYPPKLVRLIDAVRSELATLPRKRLSVSSPAKGVRVFVSGRDVGSPPVTLTLARGRYRVSGAQGALHSPPVQMDLSEDDQSLSIDFSIAEALRPNLGPGLALAEADRGRRLIAVGGFLRLGSILATSFTEEPDVSYLLGSLYDVRRGMLIREGRLRLVDRALPSDGASMLADFLVTGKLKAPVEPYPPAVVNLPEKSKTMGWTSFGAGIAGVGLAGVSVWQAIASNNANKSAKALLQPDGRLPYDLTVFNKHIGDRESRRKTAIISGAGAGVCAVTAGVLGYLSYKQNGEVGPFRF
jgi:hypothetical protein